MTDPLIKWAKKNEALFLGDHCRRYMRVDAEGVPTLIQDLEYEAYGLWFKATFFDGGQAVFPSEYFGIPVGQCAGDWIEEVWPEIEKMALENWDHYRAGTHLRAVS
jgi:hypothetical protein